MRELSLKKVTCWSPSVSSPQAGGAGLRSDPGSLCHSIPPCPHLIPFSEVLMSSRPQRPGWARLQAWGHGRWRTGWARTCSGNVHCRPASLGLAPSSERASPGLAGESVFLETGSPSFWAVWTLLPTSLSPFSAGLLLGPFSGFLSSLFLPLPSHLTPLLSPVVIRCPPPPCLNIPVGLTWRLDFQRLGRRPARLRRLGNECWGWQFQHFQVRWFF